jgi:hypothetical protein
MFAFAFQLLCHTVGPGVAQASCMMIRNGVTAIVCVCVIATIGVGQERSRDDDSLRERAQRLEPYIVQSAARYGIDPRLLWTLCFVESRFRVDAISPKGARGPMQFMSDTAALYGLNNPHDPQTAIDAGARYLRDLLKKFDGRVDLAVAAYNAGAGAVQSYLTGKPLLLRTGKVINPRGITNGGIPPYPETQNYVNSILRWSFGSTPVSRTDQKQNQSFTFSKKIARKKFSSQPITTSSFIDVEP